MKKAEIISILENTVIPDDCPGNSQSVEFARVNLINALKSGDRSINYPDHHAVDIAGPCICVRRLAIIAGLEKALLIHTGIYRTGVTYFTNHYNPDYYN
jgi:hypothetical protein